MLVHTNSTRDSYKQCLQYKAMFRFKQSLSKKNGEKIVLFKEYDPQTQCVRVTKKEHLTCFSP